jgi:putative ABC transport system permease protein
MTDWRAIVIREARATGAPDLDDHTVEELATHLEDLYQAARARGADDGAARGEALRALRESRLAALTESRPTLHRTRSLTAVSAWQSLGAGLRQFRAHRGFALLAVLVLGLGTGASAVVYTLVDGVILRPLPYAEPDRLVSLWDTNVERGVTHEPLSPVNFMDDRDLPVFTDAAAWWRPDVNLTDPGMDPVRVRAIETGANLFEVLRVRPQIGPGFPAGGPHFSGELIAVISDRLWRARYDANPGVVGKPLVFNGTAYTIVGVMPPRFDFPGEIDVWQRSRWDFRQHSRAAHFMEAVARLAPGVGEEQASAALTTLAARLEKDFPSTNRAWGIRLVPLLDDQLGYYRPALIVLFGAVGLLMVISCLNVASLLLTRALGREREMAVRTALGASPWQLVAQLLAEGSVLSLAGAAVGLLAATLALPVIVAHTPVPVPRLAEAAINLRVLGFILASATVTTLVFGLVPALATVRRTLTTDLKSGDRSVSRASRTLYHGLVAGEVALAGALLVLSILLVRTVGQMTEVPTGVGQPAVMTASVQLSGRDYADWTAVAAQYDTILDRLRQQPGVRHAGASNFLPLDAGWRVRFAIEGQPVARENEAPQAQHFSVTDGYFEAIGARLVAGRFFEARDTVTSTPVVVVNEMFARRYLAAGRATESIFSTTATGIGPLGRNLVPSRRFEVVGVVADVKNMPIGQANEPAVYFPAAQFPFRTMFLAVDAIDAPAAVSALRSTLRAVAPGIPLTDTQTWDQRFRARTAEPRMLMTVLLFFGALAAILAALGVYGLFSWVVALRRRELAIRLTLGARPAAIGVLVLRHGALLAAAGLVVGWILVRASEHALSRVLFEVSAGDVAALAAAGVLLLAASLVACLPAAMRAMRVDPVEGLRAE